MPDLQNEFFKFHENIKLDYENKKLRDKRDTLLEKLKKISQMMRLHIQFSIREATQWGQGYIPKMMIMI